MNSRLWHDCPKCGAKYIRSNMPVIPHFFWFACGSVECNEPSIPFRQTEECRAAGDNNTRKSA